VSQFTRRADQRKLRKAVGADAMQLMGSMAGVLSERVFPALEALTRQIQLLDRRMVLLEAMVLKLQAQPRVAHARMDYRGLVDLAQQTGAEVV
jgi:hypothetical protein